MGQPPSTLQQPGTPSALQANSAEACEQTAEEACEQTTAEACEQTAEEPSSMSSPSRSSPASEAPDSQSTSPPRQDAVCKEADAGAGADVIVPPAPAFPSQAALDAAVHDAPAAIEAAVSAAEAAIAALTAAASMQAAEGCAEAVDGLSAIPTVTPRQAAKAPWGHAGLPSIAEDSPLSEQSPKAFAGALGSHLPGANEQVDVWIHGWAAQVSELLGYFSREIAALVERVDQAEQKIGEATQATAFTEALKVEREARTSEMEQIRAALGNAGLRPPPDLGSADNVNKLAEKLAEAAGAECDRFAKVAGSEWREFSENVNSLRKRLAEELTEQHAMVTFDIAEHTRSVQDQVAEMQQHLKREMAEIASEAAEEVINQNRQTAELRVALQKAAQDGAIAQPPIVAGSSKKDIAAHQPVAQEHAGIPARPRPGALQGGQKPAAAGAPAVLPARPPGKAPVAKSQPITRSPGKQQTLPQGIQDGTKKDNSLRDHTRDKHTVSASPVAKSAAAGPTAGGDAIEVGAKETSEVERAGAPQAKSLAFKVAPLSHPESIIVSGGAHEEYMGTYTKSSVTPAPSHDGRPIYQNIKGKWMYYWKSTKYWLLGSRIDDGGGVYYAASPVMSPIAATDWREYTYASSSWTPIRLSIKEVQKVEARTPDKSAHAAISAASPGSGEAELRRAEAVAHVRAQSKKAAEAADQAAGMLPAASPLDAEEQLRKEAWLLYAGPIADEKAAAQDEHRDVHEAESQEDLEVAAHRAAARAHAWATAAKQTISSSERAELELKETVWRSNAVIRGNGKANDDVAQKAIADVKKKVDAVLSLENLLKSQAKELSGSTVEADRMRMAMLAQEGSFADVAIPADSKKTATPAEVLQTIERLRLAEVEGVMAELAAQQGGQAKDEAARVPTSGSDATSNASLALRAEAAVRADMIEFMGWQAWQTWYSSRFPGSS